MTADKESTGNRPAHLLGAISAFRAALGEAYVVLDEGILADYATATFATEQAVSAVLRPKSIEEVQAILRIANAYKVPIYPISIGLNTGYGSRVPVTSGGVVMELKRMDAIIDYNAELGYVHVQPGVTQQMLCDFLQQQRAPFWVDVTCAHPQHSLIGNIAERGFGHSFYSDHGANVGSLKVVLPQGDLLRTGFGQYDNAQAVDVYRWGLGPHYDGLFTQSNLGVIVEATIWLMPKPEYVQFFSCKLESEGELPLLIEALKPLRLSGTVTSAIRIDNDYNWVAAMQSNPKDAAKGLTPQPKFALDSTSKQWDCDAWHVSGALYGTRAEVLGARRRVKKGLHGKVKRLIFTDTLLLWLASTFARPYRMIAGTDLPELIKMIEAVFGMPRGKLNGGILPSNYWRKSIIVEPSRDSRPEKDRWGVIRIAPIAPNSGVHAAAVWQVVRDTMVAHGYAPVLSITLLTERTIDCTVSLAYDRDVEGEDSRAMACHDDMLRQLCERGYYPHRLGLQSFGKMPAQTHAYHSFIDGIREHLDPNRILAPGRYLE